MKPMHIQVFLSSSFDDRDKDVVNFFASICHGVDISCVNVDKAYASTPPEKARELIGDSNALVAIATRCGEVKDDVFTIPKAVEQEISIAFGFNKPILLFIEKGVEAMSGFTSNYCTYCRFDRELLFSPDFLSNAIASIHGMKMEVLQPHEFQLVQMAPLNVIAESWRSLFELIDLSGSFTWRHSITRRLKFTGPFKDPIRTAITPTVPTKLKARSNTFTWSYKIEDETKPFSFTPTEEKHTHDSLQVSFDIDPKPEANDIIQYTMVFESPYLNPVYLEDIQEVRPPILINDNKYLCFEVPLFRRLYSSRPDAEHETPVSVPSLTWAEAEGLCAFRCKLLHKYIRIPR